MIKITGIKVEVNPQEVFVRTEGETYAFPRQVSPLKISAKIDAYQYAMMARGSMPDYEADEAISIVQGVNGQKYLPAHISVINSGLAIPTPARFMPHLKNVNLALNGESVLYDALGNLIEGERLIKYAKTLNSACRVWLNAGFPKGEGFRNLDLATITSLDGKGEPVVSIVGLEDCLEQNCWADLESLNKQGMPTKKAPVEKYEPGKTIYFWTPRENAVARFGANSDWACLNCIGDPGSRYVVLGVFTSAKNFCSLNSEREDSKSKSFSEGASVARKK